MSDDETGHIVYDERPQEIQAVDKFEVVNEAAGFCRIDKQYHKILCHSSFD